MKKYLSFLLVLFLASCGTGEPVIQAVTPPAVQQVTPPGASPAEQTPLEQKTSTQANPLDLSGEAGGGAPGLAQEAIVILSPASGSRVTSPFRIAGIADPAFEQTMGIRLLAADGSEIASSSGIVDAAPGTRGAFEAEVSFDASAETTALLQVFAASPRDGGITHLASSMVTLAPGGQANVIESSEEPEIINLMLPAAGAEVSGGKVAVAGTARPGFEGHLLVEVLDAAGNVAGSQPVIVMSPDPSQWGEFQVEVAYSVAAGGPGRIVVHDPSPVFNGDAHLASIDVTLNP